MQPHSSLTIEEIYRLPIQNTDDTSNGYPVNIDTSCHCLWKTKTYKYEGVTYQLSEIIKKYTDAQNRTTCVVKITPDSIQTRSYFYILGADNKKYTIVATDKETNISIDDPDKREFRHICFSKGQYEFERHYEYYDIEDEADNRLLYQEVNTAGLPSMEVWNDVFENGKIESIHLYKYKRTHEI